MRRVIPSLKHAIAWLIFKANKVSVFCDCYSHNRYEQSFWRMCERLYAQLGYHQEYEQNMCKFFVSGYHAPKQNLHKRHLSG